jgi:hypothetical protein
MTPERLAEAEVIDLNRAKDKVAAILGAQPAPLIGDAFHTHTVSGGTAAATPTIVHLQTGENAQQALARTKKRRSDAGKPRPKPAPEQPSAQGALTELQVAKLRMLTERIMDAHKREIEASRAVASIEAEYHDYLNSLTVRQG